MREHFEAVEADLLAHYGLDLREGIGVRRLRALVQGLPPGGALHRAVDPEGWRWSADTELLAVIAEVGDLGNQLFYSANTKKGSPPLKPLQVRRPGQRGIAREQRRRGPRPQSSKSELRKFFGKNVKVGD